MNGPTSVLAKTSAVSIGGRDGGRVTLEGAGEGGGVWVHMAHAKGLGGSGEGSTPEQLFAMGYASCFNSALLFVAAQQKIDAAKARVTCEVDIGRSEAGGFALQAKLTVAIPGLAHDQARTLVEAAHHVCPYSNATRGAMPVEIVVAS